MPDAAMKAQFDDNNVLRFAEGLTAPEIAELDAMMTDAFNKGTINGYQQGRERVQAEAVELLTDCWNQWAYEGNGGRRWHGGLSMLEWLDEFLTKIGVDHDG